MENLPSPLPSGSILIVDDSAAWRTCVRGILEKQPELQIVAEACDGVEAVHRATELHPDLVLLDIGMPVMNGMDAAGKIRRVSPRSKIVFLTQENNADIRDAALEAGAHGYILKSNAERELLGTIAAVLRNGHHSLNAYASPV
jgi:DNA-binding NarL/FixJ family response regulator